MQRYEMEWCEGTLEPTVSMEPSKNGEWVRYDEIATLSEQLAAAKRVIDDVLAMRAHAEQFRSAVQSIDAILGDAKLPNVLENGGTVEGHVRTLVQELIALRTENAEKRER